MEGRKREITPECRFDPYGSFGRRVRFSSECHVKGFCSSSVRMPNDMHLPDDLRRSNGKQGDRDRRRKSQGRTTDDDDRFPRPGQQKERRGSKNLRDLLDSDDDDE